MLKEIHQVNQANQLNQVSQRPKTKNETKPLLAQENQQTQEIKKEIKEEEKKTQLIRRDITDNDFFKTVATSKLIIFKRIYEICDALEKIMTKKQQEDLKLFHFTSKKIANECLNILGYVQKEIIYLHVYYEDYYRAHLKLQKMLNKIFKEFQVNSLI